MTTSPDLEVVMSHNFKRVARISRGYDLEKALRAPLADVFPLPQEQAVPMTFRTLLARLDAPSVAPAALQANQQTRFSALT